MTDPDSPRLSRPAAFGAIARGWTLLLVASLALNLVILGIVAGAVLSDRDRGRGPGAPGFGPYTEALTREDRKSLGRALFERRPDGFAMREGRRQDQREMAALLRAEPFDPARVAALLDRQRTQVDERFRLGQRLLLDLVSGKSPPARRAMADRLDRAAAP